MSGQVRAGLVTPAILGCSYIGEEDGCCNHPDNPTPECWIDDERFTCCPRINRVPSNQVRAEEEVSA